MANVTEIMYAGRVNAHGKITSLASDFSLKNNEPFALYVHPKTFTEDVMMTVNLKAYKDTGFSDCPINFDMWNPVSVVGIKAGAIDLTLYDVWWGAGEGIN
ncbi:MAG: hypothetical protein J6P44_02440 [Bacteroidales bacterium]|nr:hypothetical protein [Bacteroidales bacterium]MBQ9253223.1 hypothetical protein [Bacteroidales bacterium]